MTRLTSFLVLGFALSIIGCSSDEKKGTNLGTGGATGTGGSGSGGTTSRTVSFSTKAVSFVPGSVTQEPPLPGVVTCVVDNTGASDPSIPCVTSDANGEFTLTGLATNTPILLSSEKEQYQPVITAVRMGPIDMGIDPAGIRMIPLLADGGAPVLGWDPSVQRDPAKGSLTAFAISLIQTPEAGIAAPQNYFTNGVTFTITPAGGHDGPYYVRVDESWASGATSTVGGYGAWFLNLDPGEYAITATHPTLPCVPINRYGWPQTDGTAKAVVVAGLMTASIGFACNPVL